MGKSLNFEIDTRHISKDRATISVQNIMFGIYTLGVQRPLKEWVFTKDQYFNRDLQSTIPRDYYFNGRLDFQGIA